MCRGFTPNEKDRFRIKSFNTRLSLPMSKTNSCLPDYLTLHYLPRINNYLLEINGTPIRPDTPAFVTLHRVLSNELAITTYVSKERVVVSEGVRFEIYVTDVKVLKGVFMKNDDRDGNKWKMGCKFCDDVTDDVACYKEAEVAVVGDVEVVKEKVVMKRRRRKRCWELEEIPEGKEGEEGLGVCGCWECKGEEEEMEGEDWEMVDMDVEMEGVRWALDVGIWVVCIGVGYLASKKLRRRNRFLG